MAKQRKNKRGLVSGASEKTGVRPSAAERPGRTADAIVQVAIFLAGFLIVLSRRPDAVLNAQFFAEDGVVWFLDAYNHGLHSLLEPQASYLHTLTRLIALVALLFPFSMAPLLMNLGAIIAQVLPVNVFLSSRFLQIPIRVRLLASFLYLALPNTYEIDANITTIQWHLALLACLVLLARPAGGWGWRVFDAVVLVLLSLDGPTGILLVPVAAALWWLRRNVSDSIHLAALAPGASLQVICVILSWGARQSAPNGPTFARLLAILGRQVVLPSFLGLRTMDGLVRPDAVSILEILVVALALAHLVYALRYAPLELKLFILFAGAVFALCLLRPLAGPPDRPQWAWMCSPGCGNRYYFLPMLALLGALLWMAFGAPHRALRYAGLSLMLLLPIGIFQDWSYPAFKDLQFQGYAARFRAAPPGTKFTIPINPDWTMELTKH